MSYGSPVDRYERGDSHRVPLLSFYRASRWHEDVLLEWDEETCGGLCPTMSHVSTGKGSALEASRAVAFSNLKKKSLSCQLEKKSHFTGKKVFPLLLHQELYRDVGS